MATMPEYYVAKQRAVNAFHSDGSVETPTESGIKYAHVLAQYFIKAKIVPRSILDVGCRTGYALDVFQELLPTTRAVGVDIVPEFVEIANDRGEALVADMHHLPFKNREFDWIMCIGTIEHAYDANLACSELFRVAKDGILISADCSPRAVFDANPSHYTYKSGPSEWVLNMHRPGWQLIYLDMPSGGVADMLWVSPTFWRGLQEPIA